MIAVVEVGASTGVILGTTVGVRVAVDTGVWVGSTVLVGVSVGMCISALAGVRVGVGEAHAARTSSRALATDRNLANFVNHSSS